MKALFPDLDVSQISIDVVAQTPTKSIELEGTNELFKVDPIPNARGDREAALQEEQVKSIKGENRPLKEVETVDHEKVVDKEAPLTSLRFCKFYFYFIIEIM